MWISPSNFSTVDCFTSTSWWWIEDLDEKIQKLICPEREMENSSWKKIMRWAALKFYYFIFFSIGEIVGRWQGLRRWAGSQREDFKLDIQCPLEFEASSLTNLTKLWSSYHRTTRRQNRRRDQMIPSNSNQTKGKKNMSEFPKIVNSTWWSNVPNDKWSSHAHRSSFSGARGETAPLRSASLCWRLRGSIIMHCRTLISEFL